MKGWESPPQGEVPSSLMKWNPKASRTTVCKPLLHKNLSLKIFPKGLPFFLLGSGRMTPMTERACLLKKGGRGWRIRCQPLTVSATSPAFPIYTEKVCLAEEVDSGSTWSGVSSVSLFIQKSWSGSVVLGSTLGSSYKAVAICGAHWGTLLQQRGPESFVEFTSGLWTLIFLSQTLS